MTSRVSSLAAMFAVFEMSFFITSTARAEEVSMIGQGLLSCATWTQKRNAALTPTGKMERAGEEAWVSGFISGAGFYAKDKNPLEKVSPTDVLVYVDKYCEAHPQDEMFRAATAFVDSH